MCNKQINQSSRIGENLIDCEGRTEGQTSDPTYKVPFFEVRNPKNIKSLTNQSHNVKNINILLSPATTKMIWKEQNITSY